MPIYANPLWFSVSFAKLRPSGPALNFLPLPPPLRRRMHLSSISVLRPSASAKSRFPVSRRQSAVVLTVKMVYYWMCSRYIVVLEIHLYVLIPRALTSSIQDIDSVGVRPEISIQSLLKYWARSCITACANAIFFSSWLIAIYIFDCPDSRLSRPFNSVPKSQENRGLTLPLTCLKNGKNR